MRAAIPPDLSELLKAGPVDQPYAVIPREKDLHARSSGGRVKPIK
jgi:hypothetical protein